MALELYNTPDQSVSDVKFNQNRPFFPPITSESIVSGNFYLKPSKKEFQFHVVEIGKSFDDLYQRDSIQTIQGQQFLMRYFNKEKMQQKGGEALHDSMEKVFQVTSALDQFLKKKAILHTKLNTKLSIIKDRIVNKMPVLINNLRNRKVDNLFSFKDELDHCKRMLNEIEQLDDTIKCLSYGEKQVLASAFQPAEIAIHTDEEKSNLDRLQDTIDKAKELNEKNFIQSCYHFLFYLSK
jgi:hypothetical protein